MTAPLPRHSRTASVLHRHFVRLSRAKQPEDLYGSWPVIEPDQMEVVDLVEIVGFYSAEPHMRFVVMDSARPDKASTTLEEALARSRTLDIPMGEPIYQQQFLIQTYGELPNEAQQERQWETYRKDYARRTMPMCYFARGYFTSRPAEEVIAFCYPVLVPATTALRKFWRAVEEQGC